jgi:hypothetical protein
VENKNSQDRRAIYILLALLILLGIVGIWAARSYVNRKTSLAEAGATPTPTSTERTGSNALTDKTQTPAPTDFEPLITIKVDQADVRTGPDPIFPVLIQIKRGLTLRAVGRNEASTYLLILLPDKRQGWIPIEDAEFDFDLELLPIVEAPATPTFTPTPTKTPVPSGGAPGSPQPQTTSGVSPYGQGMLAPPELPGVAPAAPSSPLRRGLGVLATALFSLAIWWVSGSAKTHLARLAQVVISLF